MAQIAGVPTLEPMQKPYMSPQKASGTGETTAWFGGAMEGIALEGTAMQANIRNAQKQVDQITFQNQATALYDQMQVDLKKTTDSRAVPDLLTHYHDELNGLVKQWDKSPAAPELGMHADALRPRMQVEAQLKQIDLMGKEFDEQSLTQKEQLMPGLVTAIRSGDKATEQLIRSHLSGMYDDARRNGLKSPDQIQKEMHIFDQAVQKELNEAAILSNDPKERKAAIRQLGGGTPSGPPSGEGYPTPAVPGNIQWYNRPEVDTSSIKAGTTGTVYSSSREENGMEVLFPLIYDGKLHSEDEAWQHYKDTGEHMGKFSGDEKKRVADADAYGEKYHRDSAAGKFGKFGQHRTSGPLNLDEMPAGEIAALRVHAESADRELNNLAESQDLNTALNVKAAIQNQPQFKGEEGLFSLINAFKDGEFLKQNHIVAPDGTPDRVMADKLIAQTEHDLTVLKQEQTDRDNKILDEFPDVMKMTDPQIEKMVTSKGGSHRAVGALKTQRNQEQARAREEYRYDRSMKLAERQDAKREMDESSADLAARIGLEIQGGKVYEPFDIHTMEGLSSRDKYTLIQDIKTGGVLQNPYVKNVGEQIRQLPLQVSDQDALFRIFIEQTKGADLRGAAITQSGTELIERAKKRDGAEWIEQTFGHLGNRTLEPSLTKSLTYSRKSTSRPGTPDVGTVEDGHRFKGGDPGDENNWEKVPK